MWAGEPGDDGAATLEAAARLEDQHAELVASRLAMMRAYAEHRGCRRVALLSYFGQELEPPCGNCDGDAEGPGAATPRDPRFAPGARVEHRRWGAGTVERVDGAQISVLFDAVGFKVLSAPDVEAGDC